MNFNQGPADQNMIVQAAAAALTANGNSAAYDLLQGNAAAWPGESYPGQSLRLMVNVQAMKVSATNEVYNLHVETSPDGSTWTTVGRVAVLGTGTVTDAITPPANIFMEFFAGASKVRLVWTMTGTAPSITLGNCYLQPKEYYK